VQKGRAPHPAVEKRLAFRVDGIEPELLGVGDERRQEAPEHHLQDTHTSGFIPDNDRLHGLGSGVVIGCKFESQPVHIAQLKCLSNLLFCQPGVGSDRT
jgi:hypothetical protein